VSMLSSLTISKNLKDYKLAYFDYRQTALPRLPGVFAVFDNVGRTLQIGETRNLASYFARTEKVNTLRRYGATKIYYLALEGAIDKGSADYNALKYALDKLRVSFPEQLLSKRTHRPRIAVADSVPAQFSIADKVELLQNFLQLKVLVTEINNLLEQQKDTVAAIVSDLGGAYGTETHRISTRTVNTFSYSDKVAAVEEKIKVLKDELARVKKVEELTGNAAIVKTALVPVVTQIKLEERDIEASSALSTKVSRTIHDFLR
jgi:hypothetical protein